MQEGKKKKTMADFNLTKPHQLFEVIMLLVRIEDEREARSREQHTEKYTRLQFPEFMFVAETKYALRRNSQSRLQRGLHENVVSARCMLYAKTYAGTHAHEDIQ